MNELHVYHGDIKDSNVLISKKNNTIIARLIDWGLSVHYSVTNNNNTFPKTLYRRPFQYNAPFSNILFNKEFIIFIITSILTKYLYNKGHRNERNRRQSNGYGCAT